MDCGKKLWEIAGRNQREDGENDERYDGMRVKCCDAGRGSIEVCWYF